MTNPKVVGTDKMNPQIKNPQIKIVSKMEALNIALEYPEVDREKLKQEILQDFLDSFEEDLEDAVIELISLKVCDCDDLSKPAIEEALRIWVKARMEKMLESLAYEAYRSHQFKDILYQQKEEFWNREYANNEF